MQERSKYILVAIFSFIFGWLLFKNRNKSVSNTESDFNKTIANEKDGKYFLVFNSVVVLSRQITKEQYDSFLMKFPSGNADGNVLDQFSSIPIKYSTGDGKYYESVWDSSTSQYKGRIEITKSEYDYHRMENMIDQIVTI